MNIGEKIKELRKKNDMTQEKLADFLCVSYQAVSKWECGLSSPDLSLIVPLARLFGVTTDELLGAVLPETDTRYDELEALYQETFKTGDMEKRREICETAVREYPGDMKWLNYLAWDVWCVAVGIPDDTEYEAQRERAIKLFDTVIENTQDDAVKVYAIQGIVQCLCGKGAKDEARRYVELFPETKINPDIKEELLCQCLSGDERIRAEQHRVEKMLEKFVVTVMCGQLGEGATCPEADTAAEAVIKAMIPDGNYCYFHQEMAHINVRKAEAAAQNGDGDMAVQFLQKAMHHAAEFDLIDIVNPGEYAFTAPLFNKLTIDTRKFCRTGTSTVTDDIRERCKRASFDTVRERYDFKALLLG